MHKESAARTRWTPGPWEVHSHGSKSAYIADITGRDSKRSSRFIRTVAVVLRYAGQSEGEANARLIAAAPEMAELLERIATGVVEVRDTDNPANNFHACSAARALLAKIKGETQ